MLARTETDLTVTERWLAQFERALSEADNALLKTLFHADSHWRDVLPLTWRIMTVNGRDAILKELRMHSQRTRPHGFKIPRNRSRRSSHLKQRRVAAAGWCDLGLSPMATTHRRPGRC